MTKELEQEIQQLKTKLANKEQEILALQTGLVVGKFYRGQKNGQPAYYYIKKATGIGTVDAIRIISEGDEWQLWSVERCFMALHEMDGMEVVGGGDLIGLRYLLGKAPVVELTLAVEAQFKS